MTTRNGLNLALLGGVALLVLVVIYLPGLHKSQPLPRLTTLVPTNITHIRIEREHPCGGDAGLLQAEIPLFGVGREPALNNADVGKPRRDFPRSISAVAVDDHDVAEGCQPAERPREVWLLVEGQDESGHASHARPVMMDVAPCRSCFRKSAHAAIESKPRLDKPGMTFTRRHDWTS